MRNSSGDPAKAPRIGQLQLVDLEPGDPAELTRNADIEGRVFSATTVPTLDLTQSFVTASRFDGLTAREADLQAARWSETELTEVSLPVVRAARTQWRDVHVSGRLGSIEAYDAQWSSVYFVGCKIDYLNLRSAELIDVAFTDCLIEELDLLEATARRVRIAGTRIGHLAVQRCRLQDVDLRQAELVSVEGLAGLRGATISPTQLHLLAPLLAAEAGLVVEE